VRPHSNADEESLSSNVDASQASNQRGGTPVRSFLTRFLTTAVGLTLDDSRDRTESSSSAHSRILPLMSPESQDGSSSPHVDNILSREVMIRRPCPQTRSRSTPDGAAGVRETELVGGGGGAEEHGRQHEHGQDERGQHEHGQDEERGQDVETRHEVREGAGSAGRPERECEDGRETDLWRNGGPDGGRPGSDGIQWDPSNAEDRGRTREEENRAMISENLARETTNLVERGQMDLQRSQLYTRRGLVAMGLVMSIFSSLAAMVYLYAQGWWALIWHGREPCDVELAPWLCFYLIFLPIDFFLSSRIRPWAYRYCCNWSPAFSAEDPPTRIRFLQFLYIVFIVEIYSTGFSLLSHSKTCKTTAPELYKWVQHWLSFGLFLWFLFYSFAACGLVIFQSLIAGGLWKTEDGADPQIVHKMESITYDSDENWDGEEGRPPRECCICMELYSSEDEIRRTPCKHVFHGECLRNWLKTQRTCPLCRIDLQEAVDDRLVDI